MSTPSTITYVGLDIAKGSIELHGLPRGSAQLPNTPAGHRRLINRLCNLPGPFHCILEPTGGYERALVAALHQAGLSLTLVNPRQVRDFARAQGIRAKTDRLDARLLAQFGQTLAPPPTEPPAAELEALQALVRRRDQLEQELRREQCRLEHSAQPQVQASLRRSIRALATETQRLEAAIKEHLDDNDELGGKARRLQAVKGVGARTAVGLLAEMPELGKANRKEIAALAGLAPIPRDSGTFRGRRFIGGGRPLARRRLYMAALVASRHHESLRGFYQRLLRAGKAKKTALVAVMRKLLILLNALLKEPSPSSS